MRILSRPFGYTTNRVRASVNIRFNPAGSAFESLFSLLPLPRP